MNGPQRVGVTRLRDWAITGDGATLLALADGTTEDATARALCFYTGKVREPILARWCQSLVADARAT